MDQPGNLGKKLETTTLRASPIELACKGIRHARRKRAVRAYRPLCAEAMSFFAANGWLFTFHTRLDCQEGYAASWARVVRQRKIKGQANDTKSLESQGGDRWRIIEKPNTQAPSSGILLLIYCCSSSSYRPSYSTSNSSDPQCFSSNIGYHDVNMDFSYVLVIS